MKSIINYIDEKLVLNNSFMANERLAFNNSFMTNERLTLNKQSHVYNKNDINVNISVNILTHYFNQNNNTIIENVKNYIIDNSLIIPDNIDNIEIKCKSQKQYGDVTFVFVEIITKGNDINNLIGKWILTNEDGDRKQYPWSFWTCVNNEKILKDDHDNKFKSQSHNGDGMIFIYNVLDNLFK